MPKDEFPPRTPPTLHRCSFCGKTQDQVRRLVAGPNVYICNECILLCQEIISDDMIVAPEDNNPKKLPKPTEMKAVLDEYKLGRVLSGTNKTNGNKNKAYALAHMDGEKHSSCSKYSPVRQTSNPAITQALRPSQGPLSTKAAISSHVEPCAKRECRLPSPQGKL